MTNLNQIINELQRERNRLDAAIQALQGVGRRASRGGTAVGSGFRKRRKLSAAARKKISAAQKARWAKVRAGKKKR